MKLFVLVSILSAVTATAFYVERLYALHAAKEAQAVAFAQQQREAWTNHGATPRLEPWADKGLGKWK